MKIDKYSSVKANKISSRQKLLLLLTVLLMIPLFFISRNVIVGFTQTKDKSTKLITKQTFDNEPIEIIGLGNNQATLNLDKTFKESDNWLDGFTIEFKNRYKKPIKYIRIELDFPETRSSGDVMAFPLSYGSSPFNKSADSSGKNSIEKAVKSDENVNLTIDEKRYARLKKFIETRSPINDLTKVDIRIVFVIFDDETAWGTGTFMRPDPDNLKKYKPIISNTSGGKSNE